MMQATVLTKTGIHVVDINRRKAIRHACLNCTAWSHKDVSLCQFPDCPLHQFRTGQGKQNSKNRMKAIRAYCGWCMNGKRLEIANCPIRYCSLYHYRSVSKREV